MLSVEDDLGEAALQQGYNKKIVYSEAICCEDYAGEAALQKKLINKKSLSVS